MNKFTAGSITGTAQTSADPSLVAGKYDLVIATSSWDRRCLSLTETGATAAAACLVLFEEVDDQGLRQEHDDVLRDFLADAAESTHTVRGSAVDLEGVWAQIAEVVLNEYRKKRKPLTILCDLTTSPRFFSLGLLGATIGYGTASTLTYLYTEGKYPNRDDRYEITFKKGIWSTHAIPGFHRLVHPTRKNRYVVSLGFEGAKTLRVVMRADPDEVVAVLPDPAMRPEYVARALEDNHLLIEDFIGDPDNLIRAQAGDPVAVWREVSAHTPAKDRNVFYLCSGPKPHSLGLALQALASEEGLLLYNLPEQHMVVDVEPANVFWRYSVESLTAI